MDDEDPAPIKKRCKFDPSDVHQHPAEVLKSPAYSLHSGRTFLAKKVSHAARKIVKSPHRGEMTKENVLLS